MRSLRTLLTILTVAVVTVTAAAGCRSSKPSVEEGSLAKIAKLQGATFTVGSKEFTEQLVLCHITSLALQSVGATVQEKCGLQGSGSARAALISGSIDMYWEYTGTAWVLHLNHTGRIEDPAELYETVAREDLDMNKIRWGTRAPANDTYTIVVKTSTAQQLGVTTISDYAKLVQSNPTQASLCVASEFKGRNDGLPGLREAYGFDVPRDKLFVVPESDFYRDAANGDPCIFSEATTTDGRVGPFGLTILIDDKHFFPVYNPALTVRDSVYQGHPDLMKIIEPIAHALTDDVLQQLNGEVDVNGKAPAEVAQNWLQAKGFIGKVTR
jgi:osmoprotectant transport system substrate-binding protein